MFKQPTNSHLIQPICFVSCTSWNTFVYIYSISHFLNKGLISVRKRAEKVKCLYFDVCVQMIGAHIGSETCAHVAVYLLPAMFSSALLESTWSSAAVQLGCRLCIGWDRGSRQVNLNTSVLWQAGQRTIYYLSCVSSALQDRHQKGSLQQAF